MPNNKKHILSDLLLSVALGIAVTGMAGIAMDWTAFINWGAGPGMATPTCAALSCIVISQLLRH